MYTGPTKPVPKKARQCKFFYSILSSILSLSEWSFRSLTGPQKSPNSLFFLQDGALFRVYGRHFCSTFPALSHSTQEKISPFRWRTKRSRALWKKSVRVAAVRSSASSVCSRLLVSHCVGEKEGGKNSASRHTCEKPAPWHSNQLTRFVIIISPRKPKGGCWEVFRGVAPPEHALLLYYFLIVMMVMFDCCCLSLCFLPSLFSSHFFLPLSL